MSQPLTFEYIRNKKEKGEAFSMLTAYDASIARVSESVGVDILLVGDSLGNVIQGHDTTVPVTLEDIVYHSKAVARGAPNTLRMVDMPFLTYTNPVEANMNAKQLMQLAQAHILKLEVNSSHFDVIESLVRNQIPICAHIGLTPQTIHKLGKFRAIGKNDEEASELILLAQKFESLGVDALLLECVPNELAMKITETANIPVIGIGCGNGMDGQVLVVNDVIGISGYIPFFAKDFLKENNSIKNAIAQFHREVCARNFP